MRQALALARTVRVRRIGKLTCAFKVWCFVPLQCERAIRVRVVRDANGVHTVERIYPRAGFCVQAFRLAFEVTYDKP